MNFFTSWDADHGDPVTTKVNPAPGTRSTERALAHVSRVGAGCGGGEVKMMATDAEEIRVQSSLSPLSMQIRRKRQDRQWRLRCVYLQTCEYQRLHHSRKTRSFAETDDDRRAEWLCCGASSSNVQRN